NFYIPSSVNITFFGCGFILFTPDSFIDSLSISHPKDNIIVASTSIGKLVPQKTSTFGYSKVNSLLTLNGVPPTKSVNTYIFLSVDFIKEFISSFKDSGDLSSVKSTGFTKSKLPTIKSKLV